MRTRQSPLRQFRFFGASFWDGGPAVDAVRGDRAEAGADQHDPLHPHHPQQRQSGGGRGRGPVMLLRESCVE